MLEGAGGNEGSMGSCLENVGSLIGLSPDPSNSRLTESVGEPVTKQQKIADRG
jgi:hypothetical protein